MSPAHLLNQAVHSLACKTTLIILPNYQVTAFLHYFHACFLGFSFIDTWASSVNDWELLLRTNFLSSWISSRIKEGKISHRITVHTVSGVRLIFQACHSLLIFSLCPVWARKYWIYSLNKHTHIYHTHIFLAYCLILHPQRQ